MKRQPNKVAFFYWFDNLVLEEFLKDEVMKIRCLAIFLIYVLAFLPNLAQATPNTEAIRETIKAQVTINTTCTLTVLSATGEVLLKVPSGGKGNGWFVEHNLSKHIVVTAGHVVDCSPTEKNLERIKNSFSDVAVAAIISDAAISVVYQNKEYAAKVLKFSFGGDKPDYAVLLNVNMSDDVEHYRLPTLIEEGAYGVGDEVLISGLMPFDGRWKPYLKKVLIAKLDDQTIQFSEDIYGGMSGASVLFYNEGKYRAIGILIIGGFIDSEGTIPSDFAIATRLKKEFFELDQAAPK